MLHELRLVHLVQYSQLETCYNSEISPSIALSIPGILDDGQRLFEVVIYNRKALVEL
jgi:hypothetical protein